MSDVEGADAEGVREDLDVLVEQEDGVLEAVADDALDVEGEGAGVVRGGMAGGEGVEDGGCGAVQGDGVGEVDGEVGREEGDDLCDVAEGGGGDVWVCVVEVGVGEEEAADGEGEGFPG